MATNKDKIRAAAQKYLQKGQIDKAIREFERLVEDDPNDVRTLLKIGDLQTRKGDQAAATKTYGNVAKYYSDQGFFLKAVAVYKQILKLDPTLVDVNLRLAELYHQLGLMSDAIGQYRSICEIYEKAERWDDCQQVLSKMLEMEPNNLPARIKLAELHARAGRTDQAKTDFARAAQQLKSEGRMDDYVKVAERLVHVDPNDVETTRELAALYIQKSDPRRALAKLQVCFRANPKDVQTLNLLATAFENLGQTQKALSVYKELVEVHQDTGNQAARQAALHKIASVDPAAAAEVDAVLTGVLTPAASSALPAVARPAATAARATPSTRVPPATAVAAAPSVADDLVADVAEITLPEADFDDSVEVATPLSPEEEQAASQVGTAEDAGKLLVEADIYIKYGLRNKAIEHLERVLAIQPHHREAQERYKAVLLDADDTAGAALRLWDMAQAALREGRPDLARLDLTELLTYTPHNAEAQAALRQLSGGSTEPQPTANLETLDLPPVQVDIEVEADTPPEYPAVEMELDADVVLEPVSPGPEADAVEMELDASMVLELDAPRPDSATDDTTGELSIEVETDALAEHAVSADDEIAVELETEVLVPNEPEPARKPTRSLPAAQLQDTPASEPEPAHRSPRRQPGVQLQGTPPSDKPAGGRVQEMQDHSNPANALAQAPLPTSKRPGPARHTSDSLKDLGLDAYVNDVVPTRPPPRSAPGSGPTAAPAELPSKAPHTAVAAAPAPAEDELDLTAELDEVKFFLQQGLMDEAQEALRALITFYPDHAGVMALVARMQGSSGDAAKNLSASPAMLDDEPEPETLHIAQLEADLQQVIADTGVRNADDDFGMSFEDVFNQFKKGVAAQVDQEDYDTHYNLGIAYKEMGLLEDAIREFELTAKAPQLEINALMMMGLCQLQRGSTDEALRCFMQGLSSSRVTAREVVALRYEVGLAYESMGRYADAVKFYEKASAMDPTFRDVANRLNEASEHVHEGPAASSGELDALLGDGPARKNAKISYL